MFSPSNMLPTLNGKWLLYSSLCLCLSVSLSQCLSASLIVSPHLSLSPSLSLSMSLLVSLSMFLPISLSPSLYNSITVKNMQHTFDVRNIYKDQ